MKGVDWKSVADAKLCHRASNPTISIGNSVSILDPYAMVFVKYSAKFRSEMAFKTAERISKDMLLRICSVKKDIVNDVCSLLEQS